MSHFFYDPDIAPGRHYLAKEEALHCTKVLRLRVGDRIRVTDGCGALYHAVLAAVERGNCLLEVGEAAEREVETAEKLHIAIGATKRMERNEWLVEKATEIGVKRITFLQTRNSERTHLHLERLHRVAVAAMKQSQRLFLPEICGLMCLSDLLKHSSESQRFVAHCYDSPKVHLFRPLDPAHEAVVLVGPEGDFSPEEVAETQAQGFVPVSLGSARLRTETAGITVAQIYSLKKESL